MSLVNSNPLILAAGGDYQISRSVRLRASASAYFNRTPSVAGNQQKWTWSGWAKRGALGGSQTLFSCGTNTTRGRVGLGWMNTDQLNFDFAGVGNFNTTAIYRDPSAWYHVVFTVDTTLASNRGQIWVNNSQVYAANFCNQNENLPINSTAQHMLGNLTNGSSNFDGYLTEINFIDGQALTPSSFGETNPVTGVWQPKKYTGTYGTNGFFLTFQDNSAATATTIGRDYSGNGNNWTPNNISVTAGSTYDSMLDVPTIWGDGGNGRGNYCVLNPLIPTGSTLSEGNLRLSTPTSGGGITFGSIGVSSGKWYWEATIISRTLATTCAVGISFKIDGRTDTYLDTPDGDVFTNVSMAANDVYGIKLDRDGNTIEFFKNNVSLGSPTSLTAGRTWYPAFSDEHGTDSCVMAANFGQRPFTYTPPTGFRALNTGNLPEPTIVNGAAWMAASLYTGNAGSITVTNTVNGTSFQPDMVWIKARSSAFDHKLVDSVRGSSGGIFREIDPNLTAAETVPGAGVNGLTSTGFTIGGGTNNGYNGNGTTFVAWQWRANGTPAVTNTAGSITSTISASTTSGFSVVTYTGTGANATVGHGLGVAPKMIIWKNRSATVSWVVWHTSFSAIQYIYLNLTNAVSSSGGSTVMNSTLPTSSVFSLGTYSDVNGSGNGIVAYCFAEVAGFSKFGSYTGNGSADGPFVFTGLRPRFVMVKRTDGTADWLIWDTSRNTFNVADAKLSPNTASAEFVSAALIGIDIVSNGFKVRGSGDAALNNNGSTYIYACFAENPFRNSLAR